MSTSVMPLDAAAIEAAIAATGGAEDFSGVVMVRQGSDTVFARAYGYANRADQLPNTIETRFATASGCKIFTAIAAMQLIEAGKFALDTPIKTLLDIPYNLDPVLTVRHLLTHSSGLPDYYDEEELTDEDCIALWEKTPVYTLRDAADYLPLFMDRPMKFQPGQRFHYNNGAFVLLALLVQQQSEQRFQDYVTEHIFHPAGMADSGYFWMNQLPANTANGYMRAENGDYRANIYLMPPVGGGDGGAFVTAPDWARFWDSLRSYRLLGKVMTEAMFQPHIDTGHDTLDKHYGLGVWLALRDGRSYEQYVVGADFGVGMVSLLFPGYGVEVTILDNAGESVWNLWGSMVRLLDTTCG